MGRQINSSRNQSSISNPKESPMLWRGIGCLIILIIPPISIVIGRATVAYGLKQKWPIPYQLLGFPQLSDIIYKSSGLRTILVPLTKMPNLYAEIIASIIYMVLISTVISFIYALINNIVNPNRYGPTDAPPMKSRSKKKSR